MESNLSFLTNTLIALIAIIAYSYSIVWLQVIFILYLAFVVHFALTIAYASYKFGSMRMFAALTIDNGADIEDFWINPKTISLKFFSYDVPFSAILAYLGEPALSVVYLTSIVIVHLYFLTLSRLSQS